LRFPAIGFGGQYLFGGFEIFDFSSHNNDINCNLQLGDEIIGLNEKITPSDISYSCILSPNDGLVDYDRADINNYLLPQPPLAPQRADRFVITSGHTKLHQENHSTLVSAIDEPDYYEFMAFQQSKLKIIQFLHQMMKLIGMITLLKSRKMGCLMWIFGIYL